MELEHDLHHRQWRVAGEPQIRREVSSFVGKCSRGELKAVEEAVKVLVGWAMTEFEVTEARHVGARRNAASLESTMAEGVVGADRRRLVAEQVRAKAANGCARYEHTHATITLSPFLVCPC